VAAADLVAVVLAGLAAADMKAAAVAAGGTNP
jgi:hypothetical protein